LSGGSCERDKKELGLNNIHSVTAAEALILGASVPRVPVVRKLAHFTQGFKTYSPFWGC